MSKEELFAEAQSAGTATWGWMARHTEYNTVFNGALAAPTPDEIEVAAKAAWESDGENVPPWDELAEDGRDSWRTYTIAALTAFLEKRRGGK